MALAQTQIDLALAMRPRSKRRLRRPRLQRNPLNIERQYAAELRRIADQVVAAVNSQIVPNLNRWADLAGVRQDQIGDWIDELEVGFTTIRREFERRNGEFRQIAENVSRETSTFNRVEVGRQISGVVGSNVLPMSDDTDVLKGFVNQNVQAIKSIPNQHLDQVERIITEGFRSGRRAESLRDEIAERGGITRRRANFIARDQISTLNSQLTQRRQRSLGIDEYIWRTSLDERVRRTHAQLEGTTQSWSDPPQVGARRVHPGEDYNCRCTPEPKIEGVEVEETSPADVPAPLTRPTGRARRTRTPRGAAVATVEDPRRRRAQGVRDIPVSAEPTVARQPRTGIEKRLTAEQSLRMAVARVLDQSPETRAVATRRQRLDRLLWNWVHGSKRKTSVELKEAARREFALRGITFNPKGFRIPEAAVAETAADLRALYSQTQEYLRSQGRSTIRVYRGVKTRGGTRGAVEAWTTSRATAQKFVGPDGEVLEELVPRDRVLAIQGGPHWLDGIFGNQNEVIVLY